MHHSKSIFVSLLLLFSCSVFAQQLGDFVYSTEQIQASQQFQGALSYQVYLLHIEIGEQLISGDQAMLQDDVLSQIANLNTLVDYRVIDAMQHAQDKASVFDSYIENMQTALYTSNATQYQLQSDINTLSAEIDTCSAQKKRADKEYTTAIGSSTSISTAQLESLVSVSQTNSTCVASNTALLSARKQLLDTLISSSNTLGERYDYLVHQRQLILDHFELLDSNYLQDVLNVQEDIKKGVY